MSGTHRLNNRQYPLVSVIILNYNGLKLGHLKTALDSIYRTRYPNFEVIVVDNGSDDGSVEFITRNYPAVRIVRLKRNYGSAVGYMMGVLNARGKYVAMLNNDVEVDPNWLKPLVEYLESMPGVAAADPKFRSYFYRDRFEDTVAAGRWIDYFGNNYTRGVNEVDRGQYDKPMYIIGVSTFFRRDILMKSRGLDPYYIFGYEDIDLGWRLYLMGYKILYIPQSIIYHKSGGTTREEPTKRLRPGFYYLSKRNKLISIIKNYSLINMLSALLVTLLEYFLTIIYFMFKGEREYSRDIFLAVYKVFKNLKFIARRRTLTQALRRVSDKYVKKYMVKYSGIIWYSLQYRGR